MLDNKFVENVISELSENIIKVEALENKYYIYALWENNQIVYIGQTTNIGRRIWQHFDSKEFDKYSYIEVESRLIMDVLEKYLIYHLKPKLNKTDEDRLISVSKFRKVLIREYPCLIDDKRIYTRNLNATLEELNIPVSYKGKKSYIPLLYVPKSADKVVSYLGLNKAN